ncbi:hypothetical protein MP228_001462 [Amoeboaphelidium protococcarum]|nr:hypothetical protein MP228_001462 [Amoeboaphelidium protococcarum]
MDLSLSVLDELVQNHVGQEAVVLQDVKDIFDYVDHGHVEYPPQTFVLIETDDLLRAHFYFLAVLEQFYNKCSGALNSLRDFIQMYEQSSMLQCRIFCDRLQKCLLVVPTHEELITERSKLKIELQFCARVQTRNYDTQLVQMMKYMILLHNQYHVLNGIVSPVEGTISNLLLPERADIEYIFSEQQAQSVDFNDRRVDQLCLIMSLSPTESFNCLQMHDGDLLRSLRFELCRLQCNDEYLNQQLIEEYRLIRGLIEGEGGDARFRDINAICSRIREMKGSDDVDEVVKMLYSVENFDYILHEDEQLAVSFIKIKRYQMYLCNQKNDFEGSAGILKNDLQQFQNRKSDQIQAQISACLGMLIDNSFHEDFKTVADQLWLCLVKCLKLKVPTLIDLLQYLQQVRKQWFLERCEDDPFERDLGIDQLSQQASSVSTKELKDTDHNESESQYFDASQLDEAQKMQEQFHLSEQDIGEIMDIIGCSRTEAIMLLSAHQGSKEAAISSLFGMQISNFDAFIPSCFFVISQCFMNYKFLTVPQRLSQRLSEVAFNASLISLSDQLLSLPSAVQQFVLLSESMSLADIFKSLGHPNELAAICKFVWNGAGKSVTAEDAPDHENTLSACYHYLNLTSRSFAAVVQALDEELRLPICIFYLVLRGLDTVEDDMSLSEEIKLPLLREFWIKLDQAGWTFDLNGPQEKDRELLVHFDVVIDQFNKLSSQYKSVIQDICKRMGFGMAQFANKRVQSVADYDLYCHYVAGLVGIGLSKLFVASGMEPKLSALTAGGDVSEDLDALSNHMGLFLQKVNIIRDFNEDLLDGRTFWPPEIYQIYAANLNELQCNEDGCGVQCLNHMVLNCLQHFTHCLEYLSLLQNNTVFSFCAIPQIMALSTLSLLYCNDEVLSGCVKIRKGLALYLIQECKFSDEVDGSSAMFNRFLDLCEPFLSEMASKAALRHQKVESALQISRLLSEIDKRIQSLKLQMDPPTYSGHPVQKQQQLQQQELSGR